MCLYIYLDESGCLGFDFSKKGTSKYFIVTLLVISSKTTLKIFKKAVNRTIKNKIAKGKKIKARKINIELKGYKTDLSVKKYFWKQTKSCNFQIYTLALEKQTVHKELRKNKSRLYNYLSQLLLEKVDFKNAKNSVNLIFDKCKSSQEIQDFDNYLIYKLSGLIPPNLPFNQDHENSEKNKWLQALDLFCWGIHRKYEYDDTKWYKIFKGKIKFEDLYFRYQK